MNYLAIIGIVAAVLLLVIFLKGQIKRRETNEVREAFLIFSQKEESLPPCLPFERQLVEKFAIKPNRVKVFLFALRGLAVMALVATVSLFGAIGLAVYAAIIISFYMDSKVKNELAKSGVSRINDTIHFMDFFVPQIASGNSAKTALNNYINRLPETNPVKEKLVDYLKESDNDAYKVPERIRDIVDIYKNTRYNEDMGNEDFLYIIEEAKEDLFLKSVYYTDYVSKVKEVTKPIEMAYYIGMPAIIIALFGFVGNFWFTIPGVIATIVLVFIFFLFKYLMSKLTITTLREVM